MSKNHSYLASGIISHEKKKEKKIIIFYLCGSTDQPISLLAHAGCELCRTDLNELAGCISEPSHVFLIAGYGPARIAHSALSFLVVDK